MISPEQEHTILHQAYVPEHIIPLMVLISKAEPYLTDDFVYYAKDNWLILVGYPLDRSVPLTVCDTLLHTLRDRFHPEYIWFIGTEVPPSIASSCTERESDQYYSLDIRSLEIRSNLKRVVHKTMKDLATERSRSMAGEHADLTKEFIKREKPSPRIRELFLTMPDYVKGSQSVVVLNARDKKGHLSAFYVVELGAESFATYVVGCHSKKRYMAHASDLLFFEMIRLAQESGKMSINLGLGVNPGIRRFKEKWGGVPFLNYEFCEHHIGYTKPYSLLKSLEGKL
jgi:hypothetical protein